MIRFIDESDNELMGLDIRVSPVGIPRVNRAYILRRHRSKPLLQQIHVLLRHMGPPLCSTPERVVTRREIGPNFYSTQSVQRGRDEKTARGYSTEYEKSPDRLLYTLRQRGISSWDGYRWPILQAEWAEPTLRRGRCIKRDAVAHRRDPETEMMS
jgi:hypothetical protein